MDDEIMRGNSKVSHSEGGMPALTQVPTSITLSAEQFERLYLSPMMHRQPTLAKNLGNPTPLYDLIPTLTKFLADCVTSGELELSCSQPRHLHVA